MSKRANVRSALVVSVADLLRVPGSRRHEHVEGEMDDLVVSGSAVRAGSAVRLDVDLDGVPLGIVVSGTVAADWVGDCRRCAEEVSGTVTAEVRELFVAHGGRGRVAPEARRWQETEEDEETYPLWRDEVDLEPLARDAVLLALPPAPLCAEQCRGLCPSCGANRNEGACECDGESES